MKRSLKYFFVIGLKFMIFVVLGIDFGDDIFGIEEDIVLFFVDFCSFWIFVFFLEDKVM